MPDNHADIIQRALLSARLRQAVRAATEDSLPSLSEQRARHIERINAMEAAAEYLETPRQALVAVPTPGAENALPWTEYEAARVMWSELDQNVTNGEMMAFYRKHLRLAFEAGQVAAIAKAREAGA